MALSNATVSIGQASPRLRATMDRVVQIALRVAGEPLVHFVAIGVLLFLVSQWLSVSTDKYTIAVTPERVSQLALDYQLQFGTPPSHRQLNALIDSYIDDEVLFRAGLALNLDQGDEIVRRRVAQKMQFIVQSANPPAEPSDAEIAAYYRAHATHYIAPERVAFTHIYFSPDLAGDDAAQRRAQMTLATLADAVRAPEKGDPFPDLYDYAGFGSDQMIRLFGHSEISSAIFKAPIGKWSGPYRSGYGWHLVYVASRTAPALPPLASIRDTVRTDYLNGEQDRVNKAAFAALKSRFKIIRSYEQPKE